MDSDPHTREKMQQALQNDFVVHCAASLAEAKCCLETRLPDILISEVALDPEDGLELCRYVRHQPALQHLPIMLLTSLATLQDKIAGFEAGADDYVVKPFDGCHLVARIRLLARIKRLEQKSR